MFSDWFSTNINKANFEDVQYAIQHSKDFIIINTLSITDQDCLILGTITAYQEEKIINDIISRIDVPDKRVIIYGRNASDNSPEKKYKQLQNLGIIEISIYSGGLFEWLLLQDIYGKKAFPTTTTTKNVDLLRYKGEKLFC